MRDNRSGMSHWHRRRRQGLSVGRRSLRSMMLWLLLLLLQDLLRRDLMSHLFMRLRRYLRQKWSRFRLGRRRMNNGDDSVMR